jgi:hypothetical protein
MFSPMFKFKKNRCTMRCTRTTQLSPTTRILPAQSEVIRFRIRGPQAEVLPHNPEVVGSNPTPATMGVTRKTSKRPFSFSVTGQPETLPSLVNYIRVVPIPQIGYNWEEILRKLPFCGAVQASRGIFRTRNT